MIKITYYHSTNRPPVLYLFTGLQHVVYLENYDDHPVIEVNETEFVDGFGKALNYSAALEEVYRFEVARIPDSQRMALELIRYHDTIKVMDLATGIERTAKSFEVEFTPTDDNMSKGVFSVLFDRVEVRPCPQTIIINEVCP